nr:atrial natriuretic peptide receptor 1-like [Rhipicephalus microplus]
MGNGEFVFINVNLIESQSEQNGLGWFKQNDRMNRVAKLMYQSLLVIRVRVPTSVEYRNFVALLIKYARDNYNSLIYDHDINPVVAAFYDSVLMYAWSLNETLADGGDPRDGRTLARRLWNNTFRAGLTGDISINENGDREADYTLNDLDPDTGVMVPVGTYLGATQEFEYVMGTEIHWPGSRNGPPLDVPECGFQGDEPQCQGSEVFPPYATAGIALAGFIAIAGISAFFIIKKIQYESQLNDQWWKISWDDITLPGKALSKSRLSIPSHNDSSMASQASYMKSTSNVSTLQGLKISGVQLGTVKGIRVAIKPLDVKKIHVNRQLLAEIKMVHDLTHENLVRFVGLCVEEPNISVITELCPRGSLRDMLENEEINIDWMFKCSMITDIVEGLNYLHGTPIQYHGRLKSTKCIVDGRFVVKLSDYGMRHLHAQLPEPEDKNPRSMFWTAPEFLRLKEPRQHSSQKGDIYAFAIILQEVITRSGPYESLERIGRARSVMEPEEILDRVKMGTTPPFRPEVSPDECPADMLRLMRVCWAEAPTDRPTISEVRHAVKKITKGLSSKNFFDNLLQRMEQYANNLESLVEEKTQSLLEEKKRTDELLYQLLPKYVADELKKGSHVQPEAFESVTIFFSDIVGFTSLSADSSPMQVVTLLNDLYTCFDAIIDKHDAYKVETIGDAYLVASGLPIRNGNEHVREIARIALSLRHQLQFFKIRHLPKRKLQLRIGIHSGPCVAGVVGLKMPKYCLFGDTVNTASRMETTGEPLKIHVSSKAKELLDNFGNFELTLRGEVQVKGKGLMTTYWLEGERNREPEAEQ